MDKEGNCPVCSEFGRTGTLVLRNINAEEAIYVCSHPQCPYPIGLSAQLIANPIPEFNQQPEASRVESEPLDCGNTESHSPQVEPEIEYRLVVEDVNVFLDPEDNTLLNKLMDEL